MNRDLLVTGSAGLVGHALRQLAPQDAEFLTRQQADLTDFGSTNTVFSLLRPRRVIHLAAVVGGLGGNMIHSGEYFRNNILLNLNVLEAARLAGVEKLVSFMSTCVFPDRCQYPLNEASLHLGPPHPSNFGYAYAKRMLEVQSAAYRNEWNCNFIVAIPTNIYGPNDNFSLTEGHVIPSLIHRCHVAMQRGEDLVLWGSGKPLREFVHSDDIARLTLWLLDNYGEDQPIILSSGVEVSIMELAETIADVMGFKGRLIFDSTKPDGQLRKPSDVSKLRRYLPDFEFTPLRKGLEQTVAWFLAHYPEVRGK
jgi:GDP-L-fucose synthase